MVINLVDLDEHTREIKILQRVCCVSISCLDRISIYLSDSLKGDYQSTSIYLHHVLLCWLRISDHIFFLLVRNAYQERDSCTAGFRLAVQLSFKP